MLNKINNFGDNRLLQQDWMFNIPNNGISVLWGVTKDLTKINALHMIIQIN